MNIQELERQPHLWSLGLKTVFLKPSFPCFLSVFAASHSSKGYCSCLPSNSASPQAPQPSSRGGSTGPSAAGHGSAQALARWLFGASHTVGFLTNWLPGERTEQDRGCCESQAKARSSDSLDDLSRTTPFISPAAQQTGAHRAAFRQQQIS